MTGQDDAPEGFLGRWSRKKIEAEREAPAVPAAPGETETPPDQTALDKPASAAPPSASPVKAPAVPEPAFDLASLPSLDSITAATDIRAFLSPGVPADLARAALRRAWAADPAIRDFVGLAENAWDFTDPDAMAGFGPLSPDFDVKKLVAQIFGERDATAEPKPEAVPEGIVEAEPVTAPDPAAEPGVPVPEFQAPEEQVVLQRPADDLVQRDNIIASHHSSSADEAEEQKKRRPHGGALPQ